MFEFVTPEKVVTHEGQGLPLLLEIYRTGLANTTANVTLSAYEVTNYYKLQWQVPIVFLPGIVSIPLGFGVIDDLVHE